MTTFRVQASIAAEATYLDKRILALVQLAWWLCASFVVVRLQLLVLRGSPHTRRHVTPVRARLAWPQRRRTDSIHDVAQAGSGSGKRVWWRCQEGDLWQAPVYSRATWFGRVARLDPGGPVSCLRC